MKTRESGSGIQERCHIKDAHVTIITILQTKFIKGGLTIKTQIICYFVCNFGHLLVPELIMKG